MSLGEKRNTENHRLLDQTIIFAAFFQLLFLFVSFTSTSTWAEDTNAANDDKEISLLDHVTPAETDVPPFPLILSWYSSKNKKFENKWDTKMQWRWIERKPLMNGSDLESIPEAEPTEKVPALRTWVVVPGRFRLIAAALENIDAAADIYIEKEVSDYPEPKKDYYDTVVSIDIIRKRKTERVHFTVKDKIKNTYHKIYLQLDYKEHYPGLVVDELCEKLGISIAETKRLAKFFYVAIECHDNYDRNQLDIWTTPDSTFRNERFHTDPIHISQNRIRIELHKPVFGASEKLSIGQVAIADLEKADTSLYAVYYQPENMPPRFHATLGIGSSYVQTLIPNTPFSISQIAATATANLSYTLRPRRWTVHLGGSWNFTNFVHNTNPAGLPSLNYYAMHALAGYELPVGIGDTRWTFLAGVLNWGYVSSNNALLASTNLLGSQILISTETVRKGQRSWGFTFRGALIGEIAEFNRSISLGGYYQLNSGMSRIRVLLAFDLSHLRTGTEIITNQVFLGLTVPLLE